MYLIEYNIKYDGLVVWSNIDLNLISDDEITNIVNTLYISSNRVHNATL